MPVYKLRYEMPYDEFLKWMEYFGLRPIGWRDDERTYKLLRVQGAKGAPESLFSSLAQMKSSIEAKKNKMAEKGRLDKSFCSSALFHKLLSAKGGEKLPYDKN
jgi:hypothetical protein